MTDGGDDAPIDAGSDVEAPLSRDGWSWMYPRPQGNALTAVWGFSGTDVWIAGRNGAMAHYDGAAWTERFPPASSNRDLFRLYGAASNDLWATAAGSMYHWNGIAWDDVDVGGHTLSALGGAAADDVWGADANEVLQWNGTSWNPHPLPSLMGTLIGFWSSGGSIYTVSSAGGIAKWLGSSWGVLDAGGHASNAAAFVSPTQIVFAGDAGSVWFYDGNSWTPHNTPTTTSWTAVVAVSLNDVWVSDGLTAAHWNGVMWSGGNTGGSGAASTAGLWLDPSGMPWLATSNSEVRTWSGTSWAPRTLGVSDLVNVGGTTDDDIWVTTIDSGTRHWDGFTWTDVLAPAQAAGCVTRDLWASAANDVWVALACRAALQDDMAPRKLMHWTGSAWSLVGSLGSEPAPIGALGFTALWGSAANDVYAVAPTAVYHFNGTDWSPVSNGPPGGAAVFGANANDLYVVNGPQIWHWNGASWTSKTPPTSIVSGLQTSASSIWLGGTTDGTFYDGTFFVTSMFVNTPIGVASDVFVQEWSSSLEEVRYLGGFTGTRFATPAFFQQKDAWRSPSGKTYVVTGYPGGLVVHGPD